MDIKMDMENGGIEKKIGNFYFCEIIGSNFKGIR